MAKSQLGHWENHPNYPLDDWKAEVANDDTRLGYHEWVMHKIEADICPTCRRLQNPPEPGRHHPSCQDNPAYRPGDWN
jgi:hypothetical protein